MKKAYVKPVAFFVTVHDPLCSDVDFIPVSSLMPLDDSEESEGV